MKKVLLMLFCAFITVAICMFSVSAETVTGDCGYDAYFSFDTETGELTVFGSGYFDTANEYIPYADSIVSVVIEPGIEGIESDVFWMCPNLTEIVIPDTVIFIDEYTFDECPGLKNTVDGVVYIKTKDNPHFMIYDISKWSITALNIPSSTRFITEYALQLLSLTDVAEINAAEDNPYYASVDGVLFNKNKTKLICYPACKSGTSYVVPESVTSLGDVAFMGCIELENITLSDNLIYIGDSAFYDSGIKSITIPQNVDSLCGSAFSQCRELSEILVDEDNMYYAEFDGILYSKDKSVVVRFPQNHGATAFSIPDGALKIGDSAFAYCTKLTDVQIPQSVTVIEDYAFADCSGLTSFVLPNGVTAIGMSAFSDCTGIMEFVIPSGVLKIESYTFSGCQNLEKITIPDSVTEIGNRVFENCEKLHGIELPKTLTELGSSVFKNCKSLTSIVIPEGVKRISSGMFENCTSLKTVVIPEGVSTINPRSFLNCSNLSSVTIPRSVSSISYFAFEGCPESLTIRCYKDSKAASVAQTYGFKTVFLDELAEIQGDIDGDGAITVYDAVVSLKAVINGLELDRADMNGDGEITLIDVLRILKSVTE